MTRTRSKTFRHAQRLACGLLVAGVAMPLGAVAQTVVTLGDYVSSQPVGIALDDAGDVLYDVLFNGSNSLGPVHAMLASGGSVPTRNPVRIDIGSGFRFPGGLAVDPATLDVFVADTDNDAVKEIVFADGSIRTLGSGFFRPAALARDRRGNLFVIDGGGDTIKEIVAVGGVIPDHPTIRVLGSAGQRGFEGPALGVETDAAGNVYWLDVPTPGYPANALKTWTAVGGTVPDNPTAVTLASGFLLPTDAAVDRYGNVFVCDAGNNEVDRVVAVNGSIPPNPQIQALRGDFSGPNAVALDTYGNLYVSDGGNWLIKEVLLSDTIFRNGWELPPRGFPAPTP